MFGLTKFTHLWEKYNPDISVVTEEYAYTADDKFNMKDRNFKFAFTVEDYLTNEMKDDPSYVKYLVSLSSYKDNKWNDKQLTFHRCTDDDYDSFYQIDKSSEVLL